MRFAERLTDRNLWIFVFGILVYTTIRFIEAAGLWLEKEWAEWFALLSGSMYLPWEIWELARHADAWKWIIFIFNVAIVVYLAWLRITMHNERKRRPTDKRLDKPSPAI